MRPKDAPSLRSMRSAHWFSLVRQTHRRCDDVPIPIQDDDARTETTEPFYESLRFACAERH